MEEMIHNKLEITWGVAIKFWFSFIWRVMLCTFLLGLIIGIIIPALLKSGNKEALELGLRAFIFLVSIFISIGIMKQVLQKFVNKMKE